jgi:hypothetical protein
VLLSLCDALIERKASHKETARIGASQSPPFFILRLYFLSERNRAKPESCAAIKKASAA